MSDEPVGRRMNHRESLLDSYSHYRHHVRLGRLHSVYRALYYEIRHREPWSK